MKKVFRLIVFLILLVVIGLSIYLLYKSPNIGLLGKEVEIPDKDYNYVLGNEDNKSYSVKEYQRMDISKINIWDLKKQNSDTVAWIQVDATNINYPVVERNDNNYYQNHDFLHKKINTGAIFGDSRNNWENLNNNTIIYGHHVKNNTMFGSIDKMFTKDWQEKSSHLILTKTTNKIYVWEIFSIYEVKTETYYLQNTFQTDGSYLEFLNSLRKRSAYDFKINLDSGSKILTLSTCNDLDDGRLVVHAKLK